RDAVLALRNVVQEVIVLCRRGGFGHELLLHHLRRAAVEERGPRYGRQGHRYGSVGGQGIEIIIKRYEADGAAEIALA
nr:hypothetical protein [Tanacetum cinerariifolium]